MVAVAAVHGVLPSHRYSQQEITKAFGAAVSTDDSHLALLERIHAATGVQSRHLALDLPDYFELDGFGEANDAFIRTAVELGDEAISGALATSGLEAWDIDLVMCTSVTGIAAPSLESRLVPLLGMRADVKRIPVFGLGCVAGAAGIARVRDYLLAYPDGVAVLLSVELCSLTVQRHDLSVPNAIASGLFGDGAAAVVMVGADRARRMGITGPRVIGSRSRMYPDTQETMGWEIGATGFRLVLANDVADVVTQYVRADVEGFLSDHDLKLGDITRWVCHPGGPKVLVALQDSLDLHDGELAATWSSLARVGNLSSASVLHVFADTLAGRGGVTPPKPGELGLMVAFGPGFCAELVLLEW